MTRIIKRYPNRKLYDTEQSSYVTLDQIEAMVRDEIELRIIDHASGEDITKATLAHIIFEHEKGRQGVLPLSALRGIIQSGGDFFGRLQSPVTQFRDEFRRKAEAFEEGGKAVRDFIESTQRSLDVMQARLDDRLRDAVDQITHIPQMRREMRLLEADLRAVQARLDALERDALRPRDANAPTASDPFRHLP